MRAFRDPFRWPLILVGGAQHHARRMLLQIIQHLSQIRRAGFHAGLGFQLGDLFQSQPVVQVGEASVLHNDGYVF